MTSITQGRPLKSWRRRKPIDRIIIHESVTRTAESAVAVLSRRGLSVHYVVGRKGGITQHVPDDRKAAHAGAWHNDRSIAVEVVNRYYGARAVQGEHVIDAVWAHKRRYITPTLVQLENTWALVRELAVRHDVPLVFPAAKGTSWRWGRLSVLRRRRPGIHAHHEWAHADGLYPLHYCYMRSLGLDPVMAFAATDYAARSGRRTTHAGGVA